MSLRRAVAITDGLYTADPGDHGHGYGVAATQLTLALICSV